MTRQIQRITSPSHSIAAGLMAAALAGSPDALHAAESGLPFTEDFAEATLLDRAQPSDSTHLLGCESFQMNPYQPEQS